MAAATTPQPTPATTNEQVAKSIDDATASVIQYFKHLFAINGLENWIGAAVVFVAILGLAFLLRLFSGKRLRLLAVRQKHAAEYLIHRLICRTHPIFFVTAALYFSCRSFLAQPKNGPEFAIFATFVLLAQSIVWFNESIEHVVGEYRRKKLEQDAASVMTMSALGFIAKVVVCVVIGLLFLVNLGIQIAPLLATVGVAGLAIGLALQNILTDLFASLSIVLDKPFVLGDFIAVDDKMGTVEDIGLKTTRLRSISGEQLIFGNGDLLKSRIRNYKRMQERRVAFRFGIAYRTPPEKLVRIGELVREIIEKIDQTRFDRAHFLEFSENSLQFEVVYYVHQPDYNLYCEIQQTINLELIGRLASESIDFAFPTHTVKLIDSSAQNS